MGALGTPSERTFGALGTPPEGIFGSLRRAPSEGTFGALGTPSEGSFGSLRDPSGRGPLRFAWVVGQVGHPYDKPLAVEVLLCHG